MVILIDANVMLDYFLMRRAHFDNARRLMINCRQPSIQGHIAFHSIPIIWYSLRRYSVKDIRRALMEATDLLTVVSASHEAVADAIADENFSDFEDCLQEKCALQCGADYIVTRNVKDFASSKIPAVTPEKMCEILSES